MFRNNKRTNEIDNKLQIPKNPLLNIVLEFL